MEVHRQMYPLRAAGCTETKRTGVRGQWELVALQREQRRRSQLRVSILSQEVDSRDVLKRTSQHAVIEEQMRRLRDDLRRLSDRGREKLDVLAELEQRVARLRGVNRGGQ
ncbi:unnamed protein product, partial [Phaeothamnion confervicola]